MRALLPPAEAVAAIEDALRGGLDPGADPARGRVLLRTGEFLIMPADFGDYAGVKVATVAPGNPALGRPRIQGLYVLFDAETLTPRALLDGPALTAVRTPAVSVAAVRPALGGAPRVVVYGGGPQALGHVETLRAVAAVDEVCHVVRHPGNYRELAASARVLAYGEAEALAATAAADVVVCATGARDPLFDSSILRADAIVIAIGSHDPGQREVDAALCRRARVVVEDVATALREAGDIVLAVAEGALVAGDLVPLRAAVSDPRGYGRDRPLLFKGTGMSWQDLVIAVAAVSGR
ncbi:ornithine cyclodeaminase family protein [Nocardia panacis]|uniref:ornithine cyclodeaminase family protein n=1 Tax=Nocardia panacis TaxID=2340916 RepID=UPI001EF056AD|nr:ornithine cyclodeaminase family protein [Nocardia panacis]